MTYNIKVCDHVVDMLIDNKLKFDYWAGDLKITFSSFQGSEIFPFKKCPICGQQIEITKEEEGDTI